MGTITRGKAGGNLKNLDKGITGKKEKSQRSLKKGKRITMVEKIEESKKETIIMIVEERKEERKEERIMKTKSLKVGILMVSTSPPITNFGVLIFLWSKFYKNVWKTR